MKKTLCLATVLAFATIATAGVDLYIGVGDAGGTQGIAAPANTTNTPFNFIGDGPAVAPVGDYLGVAPFNTSVMQLNPGTYDITVYGQFSGEDIATYGSINGIQLTAYGTGGFTITNSLYYLHSKTSGKPAQQYTRWDNTDPVDFSTDPVAGGIVAAVTNSGITRQAVGYPSYVYDIYDADTEQFIIGMMQVEVTGVPGELYLGLGHLGLVGRATTGADLTGFETTLNGEVLQAAGTTPVDREVYGLVATAIPEPASLLLIGLAGLLIRRR